MIVSLLFLSLISGCASLPKLLPHRDTLTAQEHTSLGNAYYAKQQPRQALQQYQAALRQDRHYAPALLALGTLEFDKKQWTQARRYYKQVLDRTPSDAGAINNLAMVDLAEGKDLNRTVEKLENALPTAGPLAPYLLDTLGNIAVRQGRFADAQRLLARAVTTAPPEDAKFQAHLKESLEKVEKAIGITSADLTGGGNTTSHITTPRPAPGAHK